MCNTIALLLVFSLVLLIHKEIDTTGTNSNIKTKHRGSSFFHSISINCSYLSLGKEALTHINQKDIKAIIQQLNKVIVWWMKIKLHLGLTEKLMNSLVNKKLLNII